MTKDKALEIAIEWMEGLIQYLPSTKKHKATMSRYNKAITAIKETSAQPHERTFKEFDEWILGDPHYHIWVKEQEALAQQEALARSERNFCSRCGTRIKDPTVTHTCTPPQD